MFLWWDISVWLPSTAAESFMLSKSRPWHQPDEEQAVNIKGMHSSAKEQSPHGFKDKQLWGTSYPALSLVLALLLLPAKAGINKKLPFSPIRTQEFTKKPLQASEYLFDQ